MASTGNRGATAVPRDIREAGLDARLRACIARERQVPGHGDIIPGEPSDTLHLVISGVAARSRTLKTGTCQITALILLGDLCDLWEHVGGRDAGTIETVTPCAIGDTALEALFEQGEIRPE